MTSNQNPSNTRGPRRLFRLAGAALLASAAATTAFAQATPAPATPTTAAGSTASESAGQRGDNRRVAEHRRERGGKHHRAGRGGRGGPHGMHRMFSPAKVAGALAAIETGIGVRPDQMESWRAFTSALVDFADASQPPRMGRGPDGMRMMPNADADPADAADDEVAEDQATDETDGSDDTETMSEASDTSEADDAVAGQGGDFGAFRMLDRMADRAIARGDKAETLKSALADLQTTLTPQQITTARSLVRSMMRDARAEHRMKMRARVGERGGHHGRMGRGGDHGEMHRRHHGGGKHEGGNRRHERHHGGGEQRPDRG
ncbi:hypothetical protein VQ042_02985 [Aurantimonas sp. A2-1-M11]|uniref:hypothetical protein n=1 Tax=Aurantimonas sp. A2-1-M11 TaxID=3113712 RepID=UPI002F946824